LEWAFAHLECGSPLFESSSPLFGKSSPLFVSAPPQFQWSDYQQIALKTGDLTQNTPFPTQTAAAPSPRRRPAPRGNEPGASGPARVGIGIDRFGERA